MLFWLQEAGSYRKGVYCREYESYVDQDCVGVAEICAACICLTGHILACCVFSSDLNLDWFDLKKVQACCDICTICTNDCYF